ncbi:TetR/AcrR family transcriptional regulator [Terriglobus roseus]|uniref:Transcriptional regulator, TetR family n=1 Tax=Terriglobus roseus TaxID=392734 RepID=A0A1H4QFW5_9BACT|nr:TetR/AcrR family transcriptional regulator [Terriglobus roseus]SEC18477.1 transcriptional regulator, TetR family [Terriglobus roseus]
MTTVPKGRPNRKALIVEAAETLLRDRGLGGVTTRAVAEAVPCSEGAIYVHFEDRFALILEVLHASLPEMLVPLHALQGKVGKGTPEKNLVTAVEGLLRFHGRVATMLCSLMTEPKLLERFRSSLEEGGKGPDRGILTLTNYIAEEQRLGRIGADVDAKMAASSLMAGSFFHQFTQGLLGVGGKMNSRRLVRFAISASGK